MSSVEFEKINKQHVVGVEQKNKTTQLANAEEKTTALFARENALHLLRKAQIPQGETDKIPSCEQEDHFHL